LGVEPNQSRFSSGVNLLGDYIGKNDASQREIGPFEVLRRVTPFSTLPQPPKTSTQP
jgi:hypothetical protein